MENRNENTVDHLEKLLAICNDGKEGYKKANEDVESTELKSIFTTYASQRAMFASELKKLLRKYGGDPDNTKGDALGTLHRVWIDIKSAITSKDNDAILSACITGEKSAIKAYDDALEETNIDSEVKSILSTQREDISSALRNIQRLEKN